MIEIFALMISSKNHLECNTHVLMYIMYWVPCKFYYFIYSNSTRLLLHNVRLIINLICDCQNLSYTVCPRSLESFLDIQHNERNLLGGVEVEGEAEVVLTDAGHLTQHVVGLQANRFS